MSKLPYRRGFAFAAALFFVMLAARAFTYETLGVEPNLLYLQNHWQHLSMSELSEGLIAAIWDLHSQAPLWNTMLGIAASLCDGSEPCVVNGLHMVHVCMSFMSALFVFKFLLLVDLPERPSFLLAVAFLVLPSTVYYENYIFYPHSSMFLVAAIMLLSLSLFKSNSFLQFLLLLACFILLSWLWGLFHPALMLVIGIGCILLLHEKKAKHIFAIFIYAILLFFPPAKNYIQHGFFGSSSWLGLNLSQVAPVRLEGCSFGEFRQTIPQITHDGTAFNHHSIISYASGCQDRALESITSNPLGYLRGRANAFQTHIRQSPSDYFFPPIGFEKYPRISSKHTFRDSAGQINPYFIISLASGFFNILLIIYVLAIPLRRSKFSTEIRKSFAIFGALTLVVLVVGHAANGGEQQRMRYTLNAVMFIAFALFMSDARSWVIYILSMGNKKPGTTPSRLLK